MGMGLKSLENVSVSYGLYLIGGVCMYNSFIFRACSDNVDK